MSKNKKGFTIIEVVLVLAIAGLVFLMVFIALPALQRQQQSIERRNDLQRFMATTVKYRADHSNQLPFQVGNVDLAVDFVHKYFDAECELNSSLSGGTTDTHVVFSKCGSQFTDPDGTPYGIDIRPALTAGNEGDAIEVKGDVDKDKDYHLIIVYSNATCSNEENEIRVGKGKVDMAFVYIQPSGVMMCYDSQ